MLNRIKTPVNKLALLSIAIGAVLAAGESHTTWRENGWSMELRVDGTVEFTADDHDVKSISPHGRFVLETSAAGSLRRYEVRADASGALTRVYSVDGHSRAIEEAKPWLAGTLPEVIRETAMEAGPRIQRIAQQGGPRAAFREIGLIKSDHSRRVYLEELVDRVHLDDTQLGEAMRLARGIGSDGEKSRTAIALAPKYFKPGLREALFETIDSIGSDGERRRALAAVVQAGPGKETAVLACRSAARIGSDGEKASLLIQIARAGAVSGETVKAWSRTAAAIGSDGEKRRALSAMLEADGRPETVAAVLHVASGIGSDGERANLLIQAAPMYADSESVRRPFFEAVNGIQSAGEHARVLLAILDRTNSPAAMAETAASVKRIAADGEKARVLLRMAGENLADAHVRTAFFEAVDSISSDGERARVLLALVNRPPRPDDVVIAAVRSASTINSDGEKVRVLARIAEGYGRNRVIARELRVAGKSIGSDGEYRRLLTVLERQDPVI